MKNTITKGLIVGMLAVPMVLTTVVVSSADANAGYCYGAVTGSGITMGKNVSGETRRISIDPTLCNSNGGRYERGFWDKVASWFDRH